MRGVRRCRGRVHQAEEGEEYIVGRHVAAIREGGVVVNREGVGEFFERIIGNEARPGGRGERRRVDAQELLVHQLAAPIRFGVVDEERVDGRCLAKGTNQNDVFVILEPGSEFGATGRRRGERLAIGAEREAGGHRRGATKQVSTIK